MKNGFYEMINKDNIERLAEALGESINNGRTFIQENIFLVEDNLIAKRGREKDIKNEYNIGVESFNSNVHVPKMYGIISPKVMQGFCKKMINPFGWYVIRQKIEGERRGDLSGADREEADKQFEEEIKKIIALGIAPYYSPVGGNSIFNLQERRLYLIDFEFWSKIK